LGQRTTYALLPNAIVYAHILTLSQVTEVTITKIHFKMI